MSEPKAPQSVARTGPLRVVVSETSDTVTLDCGHTLVFKGRKKPHKRRCPPCAGLKDDRPNRLFVLRNS